MGFFSSLFKFFTQPVMPIIESVNNVTAAVTTTVDSTVHTVTSVLAPIPVVGEIADKFVFAPVDMATDLVDSAVSYTNSTVNTGLLIGGDGLNLDLASIGGDVGHQLDQTGQLVGTSLTGVQETLTNIFDFG